MTEREAEDEEDEEDDDEVEEEEELALDVSDEDTDLVVLLASRLDVFVLTTELAAEDGEVVLVVCDETEDEVAGIPTMTYPGVVPDGRTVDVYPMAPADICVVLVAYL